MKEFLEQWKLDNRQVEVTCRNGYLWKGYVRCYDELGILFTERNEISVLSSRPHCIPWTAVVEIVPV